MEQMQLAIFDIDGTIFPLPHQDEIKGEDFNWENFLSIVDLFQPFPTAMAGRAYHERRGHVIVVVTARGEFAREMTENLLKKNGFGYDHLIMRPDELIEKEQEQLRGVTDQEEIKRIIHEGHSEYRESLVSQIKDMGQIRYAYDDQMDNLRVWMKEGAMCYQVVDGRFIKRDERRYA